MTSAAGVLTYLDFFRLRAALEVREVVHETQILLLQTSGVMVLQPWCMCVTFYVIFEAEHSAASQVKLIHDCFVQLQVMCAAQGGRRYTSKTCEGCVQHPSCVTGMFHTCFMMRVVYLAATVSPLDPQQGDWNHFYAKMSIINRCFECL